MSPETGRKQKTIDGILHTYLMVIDNMSILIICGFDKMRKYKCKISYPYHEERHRGRVDHAT